MRTRRLRLPEAIGIALTVVSAAAVLAGGVTDWGPVNAHAEGVTTAGTIKWTPGKP